VGKTPVTVHGILLGERHRVDLALPGMEIDQFVVLPDREGLHFRRELVPARPDVPAPSRE
jgi:hypothetical protein